MYTIIKLPIVDLISKCDSHISWDTPHSPYSDLFGMARSSVLALPRSVPWSARSRNGLQPEQQQRVVQISVLHLLDGNKQPNKLAVEAKKQYKKSVPSWAIEQLIDQSRSLALSMHVKFNYKNPLNEFHCKEQLNVSNNFETAMKTNTNNSRTSSRKTCKTFFRAFLRFDAFSDCRQIHVLQSTRLWSSCTVKTEMQRPQEYWERY
jgi:hypothetical protein